MRNRSIISFLQAKSCSVWIALVASKQPMDDDGGREGGRANRPSWATCGAWNNSMGRRGGQTLLICAAAVLLASFSVPGASLHQAALHAKCVSNACTAGDRTPLFWLQQWVVSCVVECSAFWYASLNEVAWWVEWHS
jgi:hypothetical protein